MTREHAEWLVEFFQRLPGQTINAEVVSAGEYPQDDYMPQEALSEYGYYQEE